MTPQDRRDRTRQKQVPLSPDDDQWLRTVSFMRRKSQAAIMREAIADLTDVYASDPSHVPPRTPPSGKYIFKNFELTAEQAEWLRDEAYKRRARQADIAREAISRMRQRYDA